MAHVLDPRVRRFLERHATDVVAEVEADVADSRASSPTERWAQLERLTGVLGWLRTSGANLPRVLEHRDPPHPSYALLIARLRSGPRRT